MRKRKTQVIKRVTTRSIANVVKIITAAGAFELPNKDEETYRMERQEWLQRQVDDFWGIDKDLKERNQEILLMSVEDRLSQHVERDIQILAMQRIWDLEFAEEEQRKLQREHDFRAFSRVEHLRMVNSPYSVEELLESIWHYEHSGANPILPQIASLNMATWNMTNNNINQIPRNNNNNPTTADPSTTTNNNHNNNNAPPQPLQWDVEALKESAMSISSMRMSLHLEGLQKTREILDVSSSLVTGLSSHTNHNNNNNNSNHKTKQQSNNNNNSTVMSQVYELSKIMSLDNNNNQNNNNNSSGNSVLSTSTNNSNSTTNTNNNNNKKKKSGQTNNNNIKPVYNDQIEGHPYYHWDQEQMLHQAFLLLDHTHKVTHRYTIYYLLCIKYYI
jgi:hypothetical protein